MTKKIKARYKPDPISPFLTVLGHAMILVASTAVYGPVVSGLKGNLCGCSAVGANGIIHLPGLPSAAVAHSSLAGVSAGFATGRFILETFFRVEFLLAGGENELVPTLFTYQCFVLKCH